MVPAPPLFILNSFASWTESHNRENMEDSDFGQPHMEEDSLGYCLELHGGIYEPAATDVDRGATLDRRNQQERTCGSTRAQLDTMAALARQLQVEGQRREHLFNEIREDDNDDVFEYTSEFTSLSRSRSLSPAKSESSDQTDCTCSYSSRGRNAVKQRTRALIEYQKYQSATAGGGDSVQIRKNEGAPADKYRLSFVELSDSSDEEELHSESNPIHQSNSVTVDSVHMATKVEATVHEQRLDLGEFHYSSERSPETKLLPEVELESLQNLSVAPSQFADLQYDDEEIAPLQYHGYSRYSLESNFHSKPTTFFPMVRGKNTTFLSHHTPGGSRTRHLSLSDDFMYEDEDLELLIPSSENTPTKATPTSTASGTRSHTKKPLKRSATVHTTHWDSTADVVKAKENTAIITHDNGPSTQRSSELSTTEPVASTRSGKEKQGATTYVDHTSSPLYKMSVTQLQYIVQLLETKLQGRHSHCASVIQCMPCA